MCDSPLGKGGWGFLFFFNCTFYHLEPFVGEIMRAELKAYHHYNSMKAFWFAWNCLVITESMSKETLGLYRKKKRNGACALPAAEWAGNYICCSPWASTDLSAAEPWNWDFLRQPDGFFLLFCCSFFPSRTKGKTALFSMFKRTFSIYSFHIQAKLKSGSKVENAAAIWKLLSNHSFSVNTEAPALSC